MVFPTYKIYRNFKENNILQIKINVLQIAAQKDLFYKYVKKYHVLF